MTYDVNSFERQELAARLGELRGLDTAIDGLKDLYPRPGGQLQSALEYLQRLRKIYASRADNAAARMPPE